MPITKQTIADRVDEQDKATGFDMFGVRPLKQRLAAAVGGLAIVLTLGGALQFRSTLLADINSAPGPSSLDAGASSDSSSPADASEEPQTPALMAKLKRRVRQLAIAPTAQPGASRENGLGMRFVPVPGTKVWFGVWDTRSVCHGRERVAMVRGLV